MKYVNGLKELGLKKVVALVLAPGALGLGADAAIAHFADGGPVHPAQLAPLLFAGGAVVLLGMAARRLTPERLFRKLLRTVGTAALLVGGTGIGFHARGLARLLEGEPLSGSGLLAALAVAPPLMAPAAFAAVGALLFLVGNPNVKLEHRAPAEAAASDALATGPGLPRAA